MGSVFSRLFPRADTLILGNRIGRGGYGEVFRGTLGTNRRPVAVKKIYDILIDAARENKQTLEHIMEEFRRECELLKVAKHPNVVEFIGVFNQGEGEESALLVMELMDQTLEQFLQDNKGTLSREKQIAICLQVTSGLLFLHQHDQQILHRDLTAKNVLMNKDGSIAKISDFGQAKFRPSSVAYLSTKAPGCLLYMPPECLVERDQNTGTKSRFTDRGDVFSLGVLLLQIATQAPPSVGLMLREGQPEVERRAADLAKLPHDHPLKSIILQCLQDDPTERPICSDIVRSCLETLHFLLFESNVIQTSQLLEAPPTLHSVRLPDLPIATAYATAIVIGRNVFVCGGSCNDIASSCIVQVYNLDKETWTKLPPAPQRNSEAAAINNDLVLVGGREASSARNITNMVSVWNGHSWEHSIPALPTKRFRPGVTTYGTYLIVAGGRAADNQTLLSSVDVLNTATRQWQTPANLQLPRPMYEMQMTVCASHIYMTNATILYDDLTNANTPSNSVWQLPVSRVVKVLENEERGPIQWVETAPTPFYRSVLFQHTAHPLAVGGHGDSDNPTPNIAMFDPRSSKWSTVGQLLDPRIRCTVVSLNMHSFLVCGGCSVSENLVHLSSLLNSVELVELVHMS